MWRVHCSYDLTDDWEELDSKLFEIAGDRSIASILSCDSRTLKKIREHVWYVDFIEEASRMVVAMNQVEGVKATFREA